MRILYLTHRLPHAPDRGDRIRSHHVLRALSILGEVDLASLVHGADEAKAVPRLAGLADRVVAAAVPRLANRLRGLAALAGRRPLTHVLLDSPSLRPALERLVAERPPDVVLAFCSGMARFALEPPLDRIPLVLDLVDVDSAKWLDLAGRTRGPLGLVYAREARTLGAFERLATTRARATLVVNDREKTTLESAVPGVPIEVVPNGVDLARFAPPGAPATEPRVVFMGVFDYPPNEAAALLLAEQVWPKVRERRPDARLLFLGASPTRRLLAAAARDPSIEVTGRVPEVPPHLWRSAVAVAPLATARGVQNKVLESVAAGLPAVVSTPVHDGLPEEVRPACVVADSPETIAREVEVLLAQSPQIRRAFAGRADLAPLSWERRLARLPGILERAIAV